ncbi:MAG: FtsX-like permease family protein [Chloroflexales bacterium]
MSSSDRWLPGLGLRAPWRKVLGDLWASKTRTALAVLSIAIGVFAVGSVAGAFSLLHRDISSGYNAVNPADATLRIWPDVDEALISSVRHIPGVAEVQAVGTLSVRARTGPDTWGNLTLYAVHKLDAMRVNIVRPDGGAWPVANRSLLLERSSQRRLSLPAGQPLEVELADGTRRTLRLAGTVHDAAGVPALLSNEIGGFVTFDTLEWLGGARSYSRLYLTVTQMGASEAQIRSVTDAVADRITRSGRSSVVSIRTPGESPIQWAVDAMGAVLNILAVLLVILSMFLIVNTVGALLLQQRRQIGVMKAIGAETRQIVALYLAFALALGLIAFVVAAPLGALSAFWTAGLLARLLNFDPGTFALVPPVIALQAVIAISMPALAALGPVLSGTRVSIREAISSPGLSGFGAGWVDRALERVRFLSRPLLLALRNTVRRKGRLALTLCTLALAGAIFIGVGSAQAAFSLQLDEIMSYFGEDVRLSFDRSYRIDQVAALARATPGVARTELWADRMAQRVRPDDSTGDALQLLAPESDSDLLRPRILRGRWLRADDQNALVVETRVMTDEPDVDIGAQVTLRIGDQEHTWVIVGVVPQLGNGSPLIYTTYATLARLEHNRSHTNTLRIVAVQHDPTAQQELADRLSQGFKERGIRVRQAQTSADYCQSIQRMFRMIVSLLMMMATQIAVVGGVGLAGTMSMNIVERTREIGVLRAIGASDQDIQWIIVAEGLLIGLLSWALATLAALPISWALGAGIGWAFLKNPLPQAYSLGSAAIWLGLVLALAAIASLLPAWSAARLTVREVLAYE